MSPVYNKEVRKKQTRLRDIYGGMMTLTQLGQELGFKCPKSSRAWVREHSLEGIKRGKRIVYETDQVARIIVDGRGMV